MSMEEYESELLTTIRGTVDRLGTVWDQVSMEQRMREVRTQLVFAHLHGLTEDIIENEEAMVRDVAAGIKSSRVAVNGYRQELSMADFDESIFQPGSIAVLKALKKELEQLAVKRAEALTYQVEVHGKLTALYKCLGSDVPSFEGVNEVILPAAERDEMARLCEQAEQQLQERINTIRVLQAEAKLKLDRLGAEGVTEEERALTERDFCAEGMVASEVAVRRLEELCDKLEAAWTEWQRDAEFQFDELRCRLECVYDQCSVPLDERLQLITFDVEWHGAEVLRNMAQTADRLEQRYARGRAVFDKFAEWHSLWQEKISYEEAPMDYASRDLTSRIKRMADLDKLVPRAQRELISAVQTHLQQQADGAEADILIGDQRADLRAQLLTELHEAEKKEQRLAKKKVPAGRKFGKSVDADRNLHQVRRTPMKKTGRPSIASVNLSSLVPLHNSTFAAQTPSSPKARASRPFNATTTPSKHRLFGLKPTTPRKPWK